MHLSIQARPWRVPGTGVVKILNPTASSVTLIVQSTSSWHAGQNRSRSRQDRDVNDHPSSNQPTEVENPPTPPASAISEDYQGQPNGSSGQVSDGRPHLQGIWRLLLWAYAKPVSQDAWETRQWQNDSFVHYYLVTHSSTSVWGVVYILQAPGRGAMLRLTLEWSSKKSRKVKCKITADPALPTEAFSALQDLAGE